MRLVTMPSATVAGGGAAAVSGRSIFQSALPLRGVTETVNQLVALVWNVGAALWAWWKDNPITPQSRAQHAA